MKRLFTLIVAVLLLLAGWGLGWHMHGLQSVLPVETVKLAPPPPMILDLEEEGDVTARFDENASSVLTAALQRQDMDAAMAIYAQAQASSDERVLSTVRTNILVYIRKLLEAQRYTEAEQWLQSLLLLSHRDVEAGVLLAASYHGQGFLQAAIDQLFETKGYAYQPATLRRISDRIHGYAAELTASLKQQDDTDALLALYQQLVLQEPDYAPYFIELAAAQLALDDIGAARRSLSLVEHDPSVGARAESMLTGINALLENRQGAEARQSAAVVGVPLHRNGNHFIVTARPSSAGPVQLLIDTGASLTILTPEVLRQRGIRYEDTGKTSVFNTANGSVRAPIYRLAALTVGDWQVNDLEIGVMDLGAGSGINGLLGMNFLSHFQFFIDQNDAVLRLSLN